MAASDPINDPVVQYTAQKAITDANTAMNTLAVQKNNDLVANATSDQIAGVRAMSSAEGIVQAAMDSAKLQTSDANATQQQMLGLDPNAASYRLAQLNTQRIDSYNKTNELAKTIADKQSTTIFDDPLGYISNQFTLPADIAQHNYYAGLHNSAASEYEGIVQAGTATAQENLAMQRTMSTAQAAGNQQLIQAKAAQEAAKITAQGAQLNTQGILQLQSLTDQDLAHAASAVNIADAQARIKMQQAQFDAAQVQRKLSMQMLQERLDAKQATDAEQLDSYNQYQAAAARLGGTPLPQSVVIARLKKGDPVVSQFVRYGQDLLDNKAQGGSGEGVIVATNPAQAGALYTSSHLIPTGTTAPVMSYVASLTNKLAASPDIQRDKDPNARLAAIGSKIVDDATEQQQAIDDSKTGNIYAAPSIAAVIAAVPKAGLASNSFIQNTLVPLSAAAPNQVTPAKTIFAAGVTAVQDDPAQLNNVADGITKFYQAANAANNTLRGYSENGLPLQQGYKAAIPTGFLGRNQTLDLSNPSVVRRALMIASAPRNIMNEAY